MILILESYHLLVAVIKTLVHSKDELMLQQKIIDSKRLYLYLHLNKDVPYLLQVVIGML